MAAEGGATAADATQGGAGRAGEPAVTPLDFTQPSKFTPELRRRIAVALEDACESLSAALGASLRTEVELKAEQPAQYSWAAARALLSPDAVAVGIGEGASSPTMLLAVELRTVLLALECMLGGKAELAPADRRLSEIDWALAKGVIETIAAALSEAWQTLGGGALSAGALDLEGDGGVTAGPVEPTLTVAVKGRIDGCEAELSLLLPFSAVEPIAAGSAKASARDEQDGGAARALSEGLAAAPVLLRAEVGNTQMPIEQMLAIAPGSVVELQQRAGDGVLLYAEEVSIADGRPGASGARKALKLERIREQPRRAETYATLGRAELERARAHAEATPADARGTALLRSIFVRVWAELGRTHMALGGTIGLAPGTVVELDQAADAPVELFANGLCFARGSLVVTGDGAWAVAVEEIM